ncbi:alpha/beta fold hydrolase [Minwuia thermotolerans]|uniref:Alpha/beta hydrolase n=1 Tax=Minwuia thermotolerans TaxID=2056226 RepID=A0A2M9G377_9PROT|nr:alpha/beta fold hydrolase [Minwuia thermotolerans]PJK30172.1 alpha/beta hydrolase [Minwuia thermotolerans]
MPELARDGVNIHYEVTGEGPVLLLTHGFCASSAMWRENAPALADAGWKVVTWDMRGHGRSDSPDDPALYTADLTVADIDALLDAAGAETAVVGGMSLGGYMSLAYNLAHGARVRALLLIDTGPGFRNDEAREKWNAYARGRGDELAAKGEAALSASAETRLQKQNYQGLRNAAYGMLTQRTADAITSLPGIAVPTLVVVGDRDEPFLAASDYMAAKIPGASKAVIADAGHAANVDQPAAFNAAVIGFLDKLKGSN